MYVGILSDIVIIHITSTKELNINDVISDTDKHYIQY